ncbi:MAG: VWA domain-containing protein [Anaerolineae bacterium]|nr:VWA domain-containing protein [Anaerolineae bacterium]
MKLSQNNQKPRSHGQVLVIFAVSLLALLFFVGLAIDAGVTYASYGQLKRAVDAASVAAANNFKRNAQYNQMVAAALEVIKLHSINTDPAVLDLKLFICDGDDADNLRDIALQTTNPKFYDMCPVINGDVDNDGTPDIDPQPARKLVWVEARQKSPFYFLSLLGFRDIPLSTNAVAEAAAVDVMLVIDTSESMASECLSPSSTSDYASCITFKSPGYGKSTSSDYDPFTFCTITTDINGNKTNTCQPFGAALSAGVSLVDTLYQGYDSLGIVTFDSSAHMVQSLTTLQTGNIATIKDTIGTIRLHDDAPYARMWPEWRNHINLVNIANPEDRDGDGNDADTTLTCTLDGDRWDEALGVPCDDDNKNDAFDWDKDGAYSENDHTTAANWLAATGNTNFALVSTCSGCGIRMAADELKRNGRPGAVWVIIFLSDGAVNASDTFTTLNNPAIIPNTYPNGFCTSRFWPDYCFDRNNTPRYCIDYNPSDPGNSDDTCPPSTTWELRNPHTSHYSPYDYALDMVDQAALLVSANTAEPLGNDIAIYSIGLGPAVTSGVPLLRYMANVGDDGDRTNDLCVNALGNPLAPTANCGQYYFAPSGGQLKAIFDDIASRIYTKITQ